MNDAALPSSQPFWKIARERQIRVILERHDAFENADHSRVEGCECGWRSPGYLADGGAAYRQHLARVLAQAL